MRLIKKHLSTILISLLVGIILFYAQPVLSYLGNEIVNLFILTSVGFSNYYYKLVAKNDPYVFDEMNNYLLVLAFLLTMFFFLAETYRTKNQLKKKINELLNSIQDMRNRLNGSTTEKKDKMDKEEMLSDIKQFEEQLTNQKESAEKRDKLLIAMVILQVFFGIILLSNYALNKSILKENIDFRNRQIILSPYLEQSEINKINSQWYLMENSDDYVSIVEKLKSYESQYIKK